MKRCLEEHEELFFLNTNRDVLVLIFEYLDINDVHVLRITSKKYYCIAHSMGKIMKLDFFPCSNVTEGGNYKYSNHGYYSWPLLRDMKLFIQQTIDKSIKIYPKLRDLPVNIQSDETCEDWNGVFWHSKVESTDLKISLPYSILKAGHYELMVAFSYEDLTLFEPRDKEQTIWPQAYPKIYVWSLQTFLH